VGAVAAIGAAITAIASSIGVAVTATALTVGFETIAAVGAVVSVVGTVTHDKALSYVGLGLGLVGGVGALASSAGVLGSGSGLFGPSAAASTADTTTTAASSDVVGSFTNAATANAGADGVLPGDVSATTGASLDGGSLAGEPAAASGASAALTPPPGDGNIFVGTSANDATSAPAAGAATADVPTGEVAPATPTAPPTANAVTQMPPSAVTPPAGQLPEPPVTPGNLGGTDPITGETITQAVNPANGQLMGMPDASSGTLGNIIDYVGNHQLLSYGALVAGGQLLQGLTSTLTPAQVSALNAQAASNQAAANLTTQQTANLAQPRSVATLAPVTGTPNNIITPPAAGIINGAPPVNVTGAATT
jgi:hypothetical protein